MQLEEISEGRLRAVRPEDAPAWCVHELHADPELIAESKDCPREHMIDVELFGNRTQVDRFQGHASRGKGRTDADRVVGGK